MIDLVCIDVDGTLIGSSGAVRAAVWDAIARARAAGLRLAIASGRPGFGGTRGLAERLDPDGWHCFQNGASTLNVGTDESRSAPIDPEIVTDLIARSRSLGRLLELYSDIEYAVERDVPRARAHADLLGVPFRTMRYEDLRGRALRAQWVVAREDAPAVLAEPHPGLHVSIGVAPAMPDTQFINLTRDGIDKSVSVRAIAEAYNVPLERVMYVGDSENDVAAMRIVGHPVAMANADADSRAAARHHVGHVDEDGLAAALDLALSLRTT